MRDTTPTQAAGAIDRDGVCAYVNRLLAALNRNERTRRSVVCRLMLIFPCMTQEAVTELLEGDWALAVVNGQLEWV